MPPPSQYGGGPEFEDENPNNINNPNPFIQGRMMDHHGMDGGHQHRGGPFFERGGRGGRRGDGRRGGLGYQHQQRGGIDDLISGRYDENVNGHFDPDGLLEPVPISTNDPTDGFGTERIVNESGLTGAALLQRNQSCYQESLLTGDPEIDPLLDSSVFRTPLTTMPMTKQMVRINELLLLIQSSIVSFHIWCFSLLVSVMSVGALPSWLIK